MMAMPNKQRKCLDTPVDHAPVVAPVNSNNVLCCNEDEDTVMCRFFCLKILDRKS